MSDGAHSMTPFQEFRLWSRRAPVGERALAAVAGAVVIAVVAWLMVPSVGSGAGQLAAASPAGGAAPGSGPDALPTASGGTTVGPASRGAGVGAAGAPVGSSAAGPTTAGQGAPAGAPVAGQPASHGDGSTTQSGRTCPTAPESAHGVSAKQIKLGIMLVAVAGAAANSTFGVASVDQQKSYVNATIDDLNESGGVACRKIVPQFFQGNPADDSDLQQKCLDVVQSGVFAVVDIGAYSISSIKSCFGSNKIPYFGGYLIADSLRRKFYPYQFELGSYDRTYHDTVFALKDAGFFTAAKGFKKLGLPYRSCFPEVITAMKGWLNQAGVPSSAVTTYDIGCPQALANPSDLQQAVLAFQRAGVTNVTTAFFVGDFSNFSKIAEQQRFRPKYGLPDDQLITTSYGNLRPDYNNINGAIAISLARSAEETTPGMTPTPGTKRCDTIFAKHGIAPTYKQPYAAGNTCDQLWMFAAAADHVPVLQADALAAGLQRAGSVEFSFPQGPNTFAQAGATTGGQFYRYTAFTTSCNCWRITDRTFHASTFKG